MKSKRQRILAIGIVVIIAISLLVVILYDGLPLFGWTYSEPITQVFHEQYVGDKLGADWRVYVETSGMDMPIVNIAVYSATVHPGAKWSLTAEGHYNLVNQTFEWTWWDNN